MHAYLIVGKNNQKIESEIEKIVEDKKARKIGFELKKITDVRELSKFTSLATSDRTIIVINNFNEASTDAQNAFLKELEEPQESLTYVLTAQSQDSVLPTISSRCQLIEVSGKPEINKDELDKATKFLDMKKGERLREISKITKREDALNLVNSIVFVLHEQLKKNPHLVKATEIAIETTKRIEANGNVQLQLTNLVIYLN